MVNSNLETNHMPRIVFMGTPDFAVAALDACFRLGEVVGVVTQPDKNGMEPGPTVLKPKPLTA